jgi:pyruvate dehydrogenase E2 component (dihydrolipoamide acetyltransferase)
MVQPVVMPKPGQMTESCTVIRWLKKEGEGVQKGELLFEIETDKAALEVESFASGTLLKILVGEGQAAPVQAVVGYIGEPGEAIPSAPPVPSENQSGWFSATPAPLPPAPAPPARSENQSGWFSATPAPAAFKISPRAARLAKASAIDPTPIRGSGPGGRVVEKDVKAYLESRGYAGLRATPAAKELAVREGIDLLALGVGDRRITVEDVRRAIEERPRPMSRMRQVIAQRMVESVTTAPHFFVTVSADMTALSEWRAELKAGGASLSYNDFILKAAALALRELPEANSSTDGRTVRRHGRIHLGLAVNIEGGLVVAVLRDADGLSLAEIHEKAADLAERARRGKLGPDETTGSTFTVSNLGMLDVENFTAIINPGESAILAVGSILPAPVVRDGRVAVRSMMKMTLSADHRILDGASAARFLNALKARLEDIEAWKSSTWW